MFLQLEFWYDGLKGDEESKECNAALIAAEEHTDLLSQRLETFYFHLKHAYSWPDGSLYKYLKVDALPNESNEDTKKRVYHFLKDILQEMGLSDHLRVEKIYDAKPEDNPSKAGCKTLDEYFEAA